VKKTLLNCDQVFEVLTRGPFPTGEPDDVAVEQHLRACHDCRQLAEALRPAISLMHEAVAADEALDLPEYQGSLPWKRPHKRRLSMNRLVAPKNDQPCTRSNKAGPRKPRRPQAVHAVRFLAASILLAALGLLFGSAMLSGNRRNELAESKPLSEQLDGMPASKDLLSLATLKLPATCIPLTHQPVSTQHASEIAAALVDGSYASLHCCTECHRAGEEPAGTRKLAFIAQQACQACHRG
jgi:hypothetical protein